MRARLDPMKEFALSHDQARMRVIGAVERDILGGPDPTLKSVPKSTWCSQVMPNGEEHIYRVDRCPIHIVQEQTGPRLWWLVERHGVGEWGSANSSTKQRIGPFDTLDAAKVAYTLFASALAGARRP